MRIDARLKSAAGLTLFVGILLSGCTIAAQPAATQSTLASCNELLPDGTVADIFGSDADFAQLHRAGLRE
jgi:predicted lipoprotein